MMSLFWFQIRDFSSLVTSFESATFDLNA